MNSIKKILEKTIEIFFDIFIKKPEPKKLPPVEDLHPWLKIAFQELGVSEVYGTVHNPRIIEYHQSTTLKAKTDEIAWCSSFVCWCLEQSGYRSTRSAMSKSFLHYGRKVEKPYAGAIAVFDRGPNKNYGHVGFFLEESNDRIKVLGGNQSNQVSIAWFKKADLKDLREPTALQLKEGK
jgi:uncharacterized protein (TIGR02594 family)